MTAVPLPYLADRRREALARIMGRAQRPPSVTDWRFLQQHGCAEPEPPRVLGDDDGAFDFRPGAA